MKKKTYILLVVLGLVLILGAWSWQVVHRPHYSLGAELPKKGQATVAVSGLTLRVEVAKTAPEREKGLSGHKPLGLFEGMLFVFEKPDIYSFWMKDMLFPIDIVWIDDQYGVVYIQKNADPRSYPDTFLPTLPAQYVLEVNAGFSEKNNLKVGDKVEINL